MPLKKNRRKLCSKAESSPNLFFLLCLDLGSGFRCVSISLSLVRKKTQQQHHVYLLSLLVFYLAPFLYPLPLFPTSDSLPLIGDLFLLRMNAVIRKQKYIPVKGEEKKNIKRKSCAPAGTRERQFSPSVKGQGN